MQPSPEPLLTFDAELRGLLKRTICARLSDDDLALFINVCERSQLDPFARQIYPVERPEYNPQTRQLERRFAAEATIDGLRLIAERSQKYGGQIGPEWCGADGVWKDIWLDPKPPMAARVGIVRNDFKQPVWGKALFSEYVQLDQHGDPTSFWQKMGSNQLAKCAEALGFRKAFPLQMSGLYTRDEMQQAESFSGPKEFSSKEPASNDGPPPRTTAPGSEPLLDGRAGQQCSGARSSFFASGENGNAAPARFDDQAAQSALPADLKLAIEQLESDSHPRPGQLIQATMKWLQDRFIEVAGMEGEKRFQKLSAKLPKSFKSREEGTQKTKLCWLEMWVDIQSFRAVKESGKQEVGK